MLTTPMTSVRAPSESERVRRRQSEIVRDAAVVTALSATCQAGDPPART
jgi:hypothetical protein